MLLFFLSVTQLKADTTSVLGGVAEMVRWDLFTNICEWVLWKIKKNVFKNNCIEIIPTFTELNTYRHHLSHGIYPQSQLYIYIKYLSYTKWNTPHYKHRSLSNHRRCDAVAWVKKITGNGQENEFLSIYYVPNFMLGSQGRHLFSFTRYWQTAS